MREEAPGYTRADIDALARIIYWEARGEPVEGQLAVANVVLNRVRHPAYPDTIEGVLSQVGQFTPYARPDYYSVPIPGQYAYVAVMALNGVLAVPENVYWFRSDARPDKWLRAAYAVTIGNHHFYSI